MMIMIAMDKAHKSMATTPYQRKTSQPHAEHPDPIVRYARRIQKNTAEFTAKDLRRYIRWLHGTTTKKKKEPSVA